MSKYKKPARACVTGIWKAFYRVSYRNIHYKRGRLYINSYLSINGACFLNVRGTEKLLLISVPGNHTRIRVMMFTMRVNCNLLNGNFLFVNLNE